MLDQSNPNDYGTGSQKGAADSVAGKAKEGAGKAREELGKAQDDPQLEAEGRFEKECGEGARQTRQVRAKQ